MNIPAKTFPTIGCCVLDCGLCPRYYTVGTSRCPGCAGHDFFNKHPSCSFITCCVKKKNLEVCAECPEFPCSKFKSEEEYQQLKQYSSYPPYKKVMSNLNFIKEHGINDFMEQQKKRIKLLEIMIENFDDGRSRSFFCKVATLLDLTDLKSSLDKATRKIKTDKIKQNDVKNKAKILMAIFNEVVLQEKSEIGEKDTPYSPNKININLLAPCGMDCSHCVRYLNYVYGKSSVSKYRTQCPGCLPRNKKCVYLKGHCDELQNEKIRFCFECENFPCERLSKLDERYRKRGWPNSFIGNLIEIKKIGPRKFMIKQMNRFICSKCGGSLSIHEGICYQCGQKTDLENL